MANNPAKHANLGTLKESYGPGVADQTNREAALMGHGGISQFAARLRRSRRSVARETGNLEKKTPLPRGRGEILSRSMKQAAVLSRRMPQLGYRPYGSMRRAVGGNRSRYG